MSPIAIQSLMIEATSKAGIWPTAVASDVLSAFFEYISVSIQHFSEWVRKPEVQMLCFIWFVVFWVVLLVPICLGFGPVGVLAGSLAAGFQSWMYGGFTPAGGVFAVLTSIGMMGVLSPIPVVTASVIASLVTIVVAIVNQDMTLNGLR